METYLAQKEERMGKKGGPDGRKFEEDEAKPPKVLKLDPLPET